MSQTVQSFLNRLPFAPDTFQLEAMENIDQGHSVVVCAPTGSGKTLIAEFAAHKAIESGRRIFYTTPLKALSNQKFFDFKQAYGEDFVGLMTGDTTINRDGRIIVMTTEIFRNMLYGIQTDPEYLNSVGYVVLDECHYMNDAERGTVWEETIIYCPDTIQLIALSATVANAAELTDWINEVHHDTRLIMSDFRPVPLRLMYYDRDQIVPLLDGGGKLNKKLKGRSRGNRFAKGKREFNPNKLIHLMDERDMLPAIFFTFSRRDCDRYLRNTRELRLLSYAERMAARRRIEDYVAENPYLKNNPMLSLIENGFASHHAGLLPGIKHLVETLFQEGYIKTVFATETLAAGINMPARSTVITKISKRSDDGHRLLFANEFHQMSGRAGRRGMDEVGYVVVCSSPYEGAPEAATLAASPSDPLNSQFTPTYGMVLNLLETRSLEESQFLIRQSFGQYTAGRRLKPIKDEIDHKAARLQDYLNFTCPVEVSDEDFHQYIKDKIKLSETARFVRILNKQIDQHGESPEVLAQLELEENRKNSLQQAVDESPCRTCKVFKKHEKAEDRIRRLQKQLKRLNRFYEEEQDIYWRGFLNIYNLLKGEGYLDEKDFPTEHGLLAAQVRAENEFLVAEIIQSGLLEQLQPDELAGVVAAMVYDSNREREADIRLSPGAWQTLAEIVTIAKKVGKTQDQYGVTTNVTIDSTAAGLVEAWAQGMPWERLIRLTDIGEGDLVRLIRRTADLLRQFSRIERMPPGLSQSARRALEQVNREPVREVEVLALAAEDEEEIPEASQVSE